MRDDEPGTPPGDAHLAGDTTAGGSGGYRRWLPVVGLVAVLAVTAFVAAAIAGSDSGSDDELFGGTERQPPADGTFAGEFLPSYFTILGDATVTENRLFVTVEDGAVVAITGGWVAQGVGAQYSDDEELLCTATYVAGHDLRSAATLVDGVATVPVDFLLQRSDVETVPAFEGGECNPQLAEPVARVYSAQIRLAGTVGDIQFTNDEDEEVGLVRLSQ